jgi:hypothetical protein
LREARFSRTVAAALSDLAVRVGRLECAAGLVCAGEGELAARSRAKVSRVFVMRDMLKEMDAKNAQFFSLGVSLQT